MCNYNDKITTPTNCHTRRKSMGVENDVWRHSWFCKWHVFNRRFLAERKKKMHLAKCRKHATGFKPEKTCTHFQTHENMQPAPSAGKHATGAKRGKTCNRCQAREKACKLGLLFQNCSLLYYYWSKHLERALWIITRQTRTLSKVIKCIYFE